MEKTSYFPAVMCSRKKTGGFLAWAGIRVCSFLAPELYGSQKTEESLNKADRFKGHLSFYTALAHWPENANLVCNLFTMPNELHPLAGRLEVVLLVSVTARTKKSAIAAVISRHGTLLSLLNNYFPEIEFAGIDDEKTLAAAIRPFAPKVVVGIGRRREKYMVSSPKAESGDGRRRLTMGFLASGNDSNECENQKPAERVVIPYLFPWISADQEDISGLAEALLLTPSPVWFQARLRPLVNPEKSLKKLRATLTQCEELLARQPDEIALLSMQVRAMREAITERIQQTGTHVFSGGLCVASTTVIDEALAGALASMVSGGPVSQDEKEISLHGGTVLTEIRPRDFLNPDFIPEEEPLTPVEACCMFRLPRLTGSEAPGLTINHFRTTFADPALLHSSAVSELLLGDNVHRGYGNEVHLPRNDRMRHTLILGQTGTGKSTLISSMVQQDILAGQGLCLIDPHGDLVEDVLHRFPEKRKDDLVLVDFLDQNYVVPMNILAWQNEEERDFLIDELYGWLDQTYNMRETGGPMFELYFRSFMRVLMGDKPRKDFTATIQDFVRMFTDKDFRNFCRKDIHDEHVLQILKQATRAGGDAKLNNIAPYITCKLNRFTLDKNIKRITGQERMAIDFSDIMNSGKVMLVNLGKGRFGDTVTGLLAGQIVSRFQAAAMKRAVIPSDQRRDFFLYVDEFQNIASENFIALLSEARKYRVGMILANQYADQLNAIRSEGGDSVLKAMLGNVGTIINFRLGIPDAELMEQVFMPEFNRFDLANLPMGNCYVSLKTGGNRPVTLSMQTRYEKTALRLDHVAELRRLSMKKHAITREKVDAFLLERSRKLEELVEENRNNPMDCFQ